MLNILKSFAEKLKYWDCNEGKKVNFENGLVKKSADTTCASC